MGSIEERIAKRREQLRLEGTSIDERIARRRAELAGARAAPSNEEPRLSPEQRAAIERAEGAITYEQALKAMRNAYDSGDIDGARELAQVAKALQGETGGSGSRNHRREASSREVLEAAKRAEAAGDMEGAATLREAVIAPSGPWTKYQQEEQGPWKKYEQSGRELVREVGDGKVYRLADGTFAYTSPGFSTVDQDRIAEIMQGSGPADLLQRDFDEEAIAKHPVAARGAKFIEGYPFIGTYTDEMVGALGGNERSVRLLQGAMDRQRPGQSTALNIAGGVTGSLPLLPAAAGYVGAAQTGAGTVARGTAVGVVGGGLEGAVSGYGAGENARERSAQSARGGVVGAGAGGAFGLLAPFIGAGVRKGFEAGREGVRKVGPALVKRWVGKLDVRSIADEMGISLQAARIVKGALMNDDLGKATAALARGGDDAMLADAGPSTRALLDASSQTGGRALAVTRDRVGARSAAQGKRFAQILDEVLGKPGGVKSAARDISARTSGARDQAYRAAYSRPINYASSAGQKIESVLDRVPPNTLRRAISEANEAMQEAGERNLQILADIADDGSVTFREMPNVRQLDALKRALGSVGRREVDQFGRPTDVGLRANRLAGDLRDALTDAVPAYGRAIKLGGDKIREDQALNLGRSLLSRATKTEDVREFMKGGMSAETRLAAKRGLRENLDDIMSNARTTLQSIEDGTFDFVEGQDAAKQALDAVRTMTTEANIKKMKMILGPTDANRLVQELARTSDALALRAAVSRNSATAIRQAVQGQARAEAQPSLLRRTLGKGGNPLDAAREISESIMEIDPASISRVEAAQFAEIADALTRIKGPAAEKALQAIRGAMEGQPVLDTQARLIGNVVARNAASLGYHGTMQAGSN